MNFRKLSNQNNYTAYTATAAGFALWGLVPLYYKLVGHVHHFEILCHRIIWSVVVLFLYLRISSFLERKKFADIFQKTANEWKNLLLSSLFVSSNWLVFIYAINSGETVNASLGYFINPAVTIGLGVIIFKESLALNQKICLGMVALGILFQLYTSQTFSWVSLALPISFALYGLSKKLSKIPPVEALFFETLLVTPAAMGFLINLHANQSLSFVSETIFSQAILIGLGLVTSIPLLLFGFGAQNIPLSHVGFLQYITPSLQFMVGVFVFNEFLDTNQLIGFCMVWAGILVMLFNPRTRTY